MHNLQTYLAQLLASTCLLGLSCLANAEPTPTEPTDATGAVGAQQACMQIAKRLASVEEKDCHPDNQIILTGQLSVQGRPILEKSYGPIDNKPTKARVLMLGGIHADELSSVSIVFNWMRTLNKKHSGLWHWKVIPLLNPDGLLGKNPATRMNANGVDLNRNFPAPDWKKNALENYWVQQTDKNPRRYPGPSALSEPETLWLAQEIERFRPDVIVSVHAPYGIVDFDGPPDGPHKLGKLHLNPLGTYPGSLGNYAGLQKNIPVVTIELKYANIMPNASETARIWEDLLTWMNKNIPKETPPIFPGLEALMQGLEPEVTATTPSGLTLSNEIKEVKM